MPFNRSTYSIPNVIPEAHAPERLMRRTNAPNESSNHMARASRDISVQENETTDAWTQTPEVCECNDVVNADEGMEVEYKELELYREWIDTT